MDIIEEATLPVFKEEHESSAGNVTDEDDNKFESPHVNA